MEIAYRLATQADADAVQRLIERAYRGEEAASGWTNESHLLVTPRLRPGEAAQMIAAPGSAFLLAEREGRIVACALLKRHAPGVAYFGMFAVDPALQAGGLGKAHMAACEAFVRREWDATAMVMTVIDLRTELIAYYERRGYDRTGETEPFPFHVVPDEPRRDFHLVWLRKALG